MDLSTSKMSIIGYLLALWVLMGECADNWTTLETKSEVQNNANRLIHYLFNNYTTLIRPRINQSETVRVQFDIAMKQVIDVDVKVDLCYSFYTIRKIQYIVEFGFRHSK